MHKQPPVKLATRPQFQRPMALTKDEKIEVYSNSALLAEAKELMDRAVERGWARRPALSPMEMLEGGAR